MKILLISFTDSTNIGDQLIVESLNKDLSQFGKVTLLNYELQDIESQEISETHLKDNKMIKLYKKYFRNILLFDALHNVYNKFYVRNRLNWDNFDKKIEENDVVILGGGNIIFGLTTLMSTNYKIKRIVKHVHSHGKPIGILSGGIGPFRTNKQRKDAIKIMSLFDVGTVRDEASLEYCCKNDNITQSVDPVLFYNTIKRNDSKKIRIGICIMDIRLNKNTEEDYEKYISNMVKIVDNLVYRINNTEIFLYSSEPRDNAAVKLVYKKSALKSKNIKLIDIKNKKDLIELYKNIDVVLGTRMHSMILAFSSHIPVVGITWQPKVSEFFKIINQEGDTYDLMKLDKEIMNIVKKVENKIIYIENEKRKIAYKKQELNMLYMNENKKLIEKMK